MSPEGDKDKGSDKGFLLTTSTLCKVSSIDPLLESQIF